MRLPALPKSSNQEKPSRLKRLRQFFLEKMKWQRPYIKVPKRK